MKVCLEMGFPFSNNPKNLEPQEYMGLFGREKVLSYYRINMVTNTELNDLRKIICLRKT